jgi:hypothetical protein
MAIEMWRPRRGLARRGIEPFRAFDDLMSRMFDDWLSPRLAGETRGWSPTVDILLSGSLVTACPSPRRSHQPANPVPSMGRFHGRR